MELSSPGPTDLKILWTENFYSEDTNFTFTIICTFIFLFKHEKDELFLVHGDETLLIYWICDFNSTTHETVEQWLAQYSREPLNIVGYVYLIL